MALAESSKHLRVAYGVLLTLHPFYGKFVVPLRGLRRYGDPPSLEWKVRSTFVRLTSFH